MNKQTRTRKILILTFASLLLVVAGLALSGKSGGALAAVQSIELDWWTVDGGGGRELQSGPYSLQGTIGQPDASTLSNGDYTLEGGFWGGIPPTYVIFLPLVER